jgi:hypothetical protein
MNDQNRSQSLSSSLVVPNPRKKAKLLLQFTERLFLDVTEDYRVKLSPICRAMTPQDAFEFRVNSEIAVNRKLGGKTCELNRDEYKDDEDDGASRCYYYVLAHVTDAFEKDNDFISFVEDDDRYKVKWGDIQYEDNWAYWSIRLDVYNNDHKQNDK